MKNLSVKEIVEFRSKSERAQKNFANNIKIDRNKVENDSEGGGDYWITCLSAISNSYKLRDVQPILAKREELEGKLEAAENFNTKNMYTRNIEILNSFESFDFTNIRPSAKMNFLKKKKNDYILIVKGIPIQVKPHYVFSFENNGRQEVGAIWFIAKLKGFKRNELGIFTDILYRYLLTHFSDQYSINSNFCVAVDVFKKVEVSYLQLENNEITKVLDSTLDTIKSLMYISHYILIR